MSDNKYDKPNQILDDEKALLLNHNYDGIQELDHPLPGWWLGTFYATIAFSIVYVGYYMIGSGPTLSDELKEALAQIEAAKAKVQAAIPQGGDSSAALLAALKNPQEISKGQGVYVGKCAACHGDKGQGLIGPNLTDDHWIQGSGSPQDVMKAVTDGVPEKGMPPWGPMLTAEELRGVVAYIRSIRGTNPAGAKEPQGTVQTIQEL